MSRPAKRKPSAATRRAADLGLPEHVPCAFCGSQDTELHSPFGSALSLATYWCRACRTAFEWIKWDGPRSAQNS